MSELSEQRWAVMSERGCEASGLDYTAASHLMRQLAAEKVLGLCVVTDEAARRLTREKVPQNGDPRAADGPGASDGARPEEMKAG